MKRKCTEAGEKGIQSTWGMPTPIFLPFPYRKCCGRGEREKVMTVTYDPLTSRLMEAEQTNHSASSQTLRVLPCFLQLQQSSFHWIISNKVKSRNQNTAYNSVDLIFNAILSGSLWMQEICLHPSWFAGTLCDAYTQWPLPQRPLPLAAAYRCIV